MATKPDLRQIPSWPERQLLWIERERSFARWMHGASARPWVTPSLNVVSRLGDGWMWYVVILSLPWLDHVNGTTCAIRMFAVGAVNLLIYLIIKRCIARPRPYRTCPGIRSCGRSLDEYKVIGKEAQPERAAVEHERCRNEQRQTTPPPRVLGSRDR